jgi:hypothetical protein
MIIGFVCGLLAGAAIALVLPRDDGPPRRAVEPGPDLDRSDDPPGLASDPTSDLTTEAQRRPARTDADPEPDRTGEVGDLKGN